MMGLAPVTTNHQGEWRFIESGVNGFLIPDDAATAAEVVKEVLRNRELCVKVGRAARDTAIERFSWRRWAWDWMRLLEETVRR